MNPPEIKNVTPQAASGTAAPGNVTVSGSTPGTAVVLKRPPSRRALVIGAVLALVVVFGAYKLFHHHYNSYEATANAVTVAIERNDMTPVLHKFNAIRLPELEDRGKVGRLSQFLVPLGAFKGSKEITPAGSEAGLHEFTETFANGTAFEKYTLDSDGKIVRFHIGPPSDANASTTP